MYNFTSVQLQYALHLLCYIYSSNFWDDLLLARVVLIQNAFYYSFSIFVNLVDRAHTHTHQRPKAFSIKVSWSAMSSTSCALSALIVVQMWGAVTSSQESAMLRPKTAHNSAKASLYAVLPVQSIRKYDKKGNSTHANSRTLLCARLVQGTKTGSHMSRRNSTYFPLNLSWIPFTSVNFTNQSQINSLSSLWAVICVRPNMDISVSKSSSSAKLSFSSLLPAHLCHELFNKKIISWNLYLIDPEPTDSWI